MRTVSPKLGSVLLVVAAVACAACVKPMTPWDRAVQLARQGDAKQMRAMAQQAWEDREEEASLRQALKRWRKVAELNPNDGKALLRIARGYYLLADGHLALQVTKSYIKKSEMFDAYREGQRFALKALRALSKPFNERVQTVKPEHAFDVVGKNGAPALYWYAANLAKWARAQGEAVAVERKDTVLTAISRVAKVLPKYWYGGPDRFLGAYYAWMPPMLGGDIKRAIDHFDQSLKIGPNYLGTKVLLAEFLATVTNDREFFEEILNEVLVTDPRLLKDIAPEQRLEQRKARYLLRQAAKLF